jgi:hypothetical protein
MNQRTGIQPTVRWVFADATARDNFTPLVGIPSHVGAVKENEIGSEAWQLSDDTFWSLKSIGPLVWVAKGSAGAGTGSVTWSGNRAVDLREATGSAATIIAPVGAIGASDQAVAAAGANYTLDLAIAANSTLDLYVRATIVNTTDSHKRRIRYRILVARDAGAPTIEELTEIKTNDTPASIYVADINPVALYGAPSISGNNFRFTVTAHATKNQKVTVGLFPFVVPDPV